MKRLPSTSSRGTKREDISSHRGDILSHRDDMVSLTARPTQSLPRTLQGRKPALQDTRSSILKDCYINPEHLKRPSTKFSNSLRDLDDRSRRVIDLPSELDNQSYQAALMTRTVDAQKDSHVKELYHSNNEYLSNLAQQKLENINLQKHSLDISNQLLCANKKIQSLMEQQAKLVASLHDGCKKNDETVAKLSDTEQLVEKLKAEHEELRIRNWQLSNQGNTDSTQAQFFKKENDELRQKLNASELILSEDKMKYEELERHYFKAQSSKQQSEQRMNKISNRYTELKLEHSTLKSTFHKMQSQSTSLQTNYEMTCDQITRLTDDNEQLRWHKQSLLVKTATLESAIADLKEASEKQRQQLSDELEEVKLARDKAKENLRKLDAQFGDLSRKSSWHEENHKRSETKIAELKAVVEAKQNEIFNNKVKLRLMEGRVSEDSRMVQSSQEKIKQLLEDAANKDLSIRQTMDYVEELEGKKEKLEARLQVLQTEKEEFTQRQKQDSKSGSALRKELEETRLKLADSMQSSATEIEQLKAAKNEAELNLRRTKAVLEKTKSELTKLRVSPHSGDDMEPQV